MNARPLFDQVIIEQDTAENTTESGIIIPDTAKEKPNTGKVIAVGPGKSGEPTTVKPGDAVTYGKHAGSVIEVEGKEYRIMREYEIFAIL